VSAVLKRIGLLCLCAWPGLATADVLGLDLGLDRELERQGEAVERHLPAD
jgi:hypothetical protein